MRITVKNFVLFFGFVIVVALLSEFNFEATVVALLSYLVFQGFPNELLIRKTFSRSCEDAYPFEKDVS